MKFILGIDPGTEKMGAAIVALASLHIVLPSDHEYQARLRGNYDAYMALKPGLKHLYHNIALAHTTPLNVLGQKGNTTWGAAKRLSYMCSWLSNWITLRPNDGPIVSYGIEMPWSNKGANQGTRSKFMLGAAWYAAWDTLYLTLPGVPKDHVFTELMPSDVSNLLGLPSHAPKKERRRVTATLLNRPGWLDIEDDDKEADVADAAAVAIASTILYLRATEPERWPDLVPASRSSNKRSPRKKTKRVNVPQVNSGA